MANDLTKTSTQLPANNDDVDPFEAFGEEQASRAHITGDLLRFTKHGDWKAGQEQATLDEGTRMLAYMPGLKRGWVKWSDGSPTRHLLGLVSEGYTPPAREDLGDMDENDWPELNGNSIDPWQKTNYLVMLDESGQLYTFVTASKGGLTAVGAISSVYGKRRKMKSDEIPIVELHSRSYNHKQFGETFAPDIKITGWAKIPENFAELASAMDSEDEPVNDKTESFGGKAAKALAKPQAKPQGKAKAPAKAVVAGSKKKNGGPSKSVRF